MTRSSTPGISHPKARLVLFAMLVNCCHAMADDAIRTRPLDGMAFSSEIEAVEAMSEHCRADSSKDDAEHVGAILQLNSGEYLVTHGQAAPGQTKVTFAILRPANSRVVALWHTHGAKDRKSERFSIQDNDTVRDTGIPFYLISPRGKISLLVDENIGLSEALRYSREMGRLVRYRSYGGLVLYRLEQSASDI